jgi:CRISPR type III-B/RAMP module-associated protein Cmr5
MPEMSTRSQKRAQEAYRRVRCIADSQSPEFQEKYGGVCRDLPALIHQCGLCQTVAFLQAKGAKKSHFTRLLTDWGAVSGLGQTADAIADCVREKAEVVEYQRLTREALACAEWFDRYAEAVLGAERGQGGGDR